MSHQSLKTAPVQTTDFPKISFITACKGRLHQLRQTVLLNLHWNSNYPNLEFVLLDYNSRDGFEAWAEQVLRDHIASGRVVYYKTFEPERFRYAHARNMLVRLASGDVICNVDADNFTGKNFAWYIAERLQHYDYCLGSKLHDGIIHAQDFGNCGRIATWRKYYLEFGAYNETMDSWGYEDVDFYNRLFKIGLKACKIDECYLHCIAHHEGRQVHEPENNDDYLDDYKEKSYQRLERGEVVVNDGNFGCGTVYKNFDPKPIVIDRYLSKEKVYL